MSKTSTKIIEEAADKIQQHFFAKGAEVSKVDFDFVCSALSQAMKTAVEEVTPYEEELVRDNEKHNDKVIGYNKAISDMEEKKRKFFEE